MTYRVYVYERPREINVEKALDVTNFELQCENLQCEEVVFDGYKKVYYVKINILE